MTEPQPDRQIVRIRKYPNRRLYDTSRSTHLTQDEVLGILRRGQRVQICDSRTESDITNEVLLQILIARAPEAIAALDTSALIGLARAEFGAAVDVVRLHLSGRDGEATST
jgi:polyhydroxyalkanoate synthesis repressor PhaR